MAITRIKNNQITDVTIVGSEKLQDLSVTAGKLENNLTYGSNLTVTGNLVVNGTTTTVNSSTMQVDDPLLTLAPDVTGAPSSDLGLVGERGDESNVAFVWDESADEFVLGFTPDTGANPTVILDDYADLHAGGGAFDDNVSVGGNLSVTGTASLGTLGLTGDLDMNGNSIVNLADPTSAQDAATKAYVDSFTAAGFTISDGSTSETIQLNPSDTVTFSGVTNETTVIVSATDTVTIGLPDDVTITGALSANSLASSTTLSVSGTSTLADVNAANINSTTLDTTGAVTIGTTLAVTGTSTFTGDMTAGNIDSATLDTSGNATVGGTFGATGATTLSSTLDVTGVSTLSGLLNANGGIAVDGTNFTVNGTTGAISGVSTLSVDGLASLDGGIDVNALFTVDASGNVDTQGTLAVLGTSDFTGDMTAGNIDAATLDTTGAVTVGSTLDVTGLASLDGGIDVDGAFTVADTSGNVSTTGTLNVDGATTMGQLTIDAASAIDMGANKVTNMADPTNAQDGATKAYVDSVASSGFTLSDGTTTQTISGGDTFLVNGTANEVDVAVSATDTLTIGLPSDVIIGNDLQVTNDLTVDANTTIQGNLTVNGTTTTVDSTVTTLEDPVLRLGVTAIAAEDSKDRGIEYTYWEGGSSKVGFFGQDDSTGEFVYFNNATNVSEAFTGTLGSAAFGSARVTDLTSTRIVYAGAGGELQDSANLTFNGTTLTAGGLATGGNLDVDGATTLDAVVIDETLDVNGATTMSDLTIDASSTINMGSNVVSGVADPVANQDAATKAYVDSVSSSASALDMAGDTGTDTVTVGTDTLTFAGTASEIVTAVTDNTVTIGLPDNVTIAATLTATDIDTGTMDASGNATVGGTLGVTGNTTLTTVTASGAATMQSTLGVTGVTTMTGLLNANGGIDVDSGNFTVNGTTGAVATVAGATIGGALDVTGLSSLDGGIDVDGAFTVADTSGNVSTSGTLDVTGLSTLGDVDAQNVDVVTMDASGAATVGGTLGVTGATTVTSLTASGATDLNGGLTANTAIIEDLTENRVVIVGAGGALEDDANLTFDGADFNVGSDFNVDVATGNTTVGGTLGVTGNATITGDLLVNGTTTTVNSTTITVDDPIMTLGGDTAPLSDDNKDRGIEFRYHDGASAKLGFMGWDDSAQAFAFYSDATNTAEVISGTLGDLLFNSLTVAGLTEDEIVIPGASGGLEGDPNFTFDGTQLVVGSFSVQQASGVVDAGSGSITTTGALNGGSAAIGANATIGGTLGVTGQTTLASAAVSDLTSGRVVLAGASGELQDSANLTFDGSALALTGTATISSTLGVTGATTLGAVTAGGAAIFNSTADFNGAVTMDDVTFDAGAVINAGANKITAVADPTNAQDAATKAYVDSVASTGFTLSAGGTTSTISGGDTLAVNGTANEVEVTSTLDSDAFTIGLPDDVTIGNDLTVTTGATIGSGLTVSAGTTSVQALEATSITDSALTATRVVFAGTGGELVDDSGLTFTAGTGALAVTGSAAIDNITIDGNTISSTDLNGNVVLDPNGTGYIDASTSLIKNVVDPVAAQDAATKAYVDSATSSASALTISDGTATDTVTVGTDQFDILGTANEVTTAVTDNTVTIGLPDDVTITQHLSVGGNATVTGNLNVLGTTTTVDSTTVTIADPIFTMGDDAVDDNKDRGIEMKYNDGSANLAFMGYDDSTGKFTMLTDATNTAEVFSGTAGGLVIGALEATSGQFSGAISAGGLATLDGGITTDGGAFTVADTSGNVATSGTLNVTGLASLDGGIDVDGAFTVQDNTGNVSTTGTLAAGNTTITGTQSVSGLLSANGGIAVDGTAFTVADGSGNVKTEGTIESDGQATFASANVEDLTSGRVVLAGTAGELEDSANLTFNGTTLTVGAATVNSVSGAINTTGNLTVGGATDLNGANTFAGFTVDATSTVDMGANRVTNVANPTAAQDAATKDYVDSIASTGWTISDGSNTSVVAGGDTLTVNGTANEVEVAVTLNGDAFTIGLPDDVTIGDALTVTGDLQGSTATFSGAVSTGAASVTTLDASGLASLDGGIDVDGAFTVADTTGNVSTGGTLAVTGTSTFTGDMTAGNIDSTTLDTTGAVTVGTTLGVTGESTLASAIVSDLTDNRVVIAGASGALEDDGNFTFDGTSLNVGAGNMTVAVASGNMYTAGSLEVDGTANLDAAVNINGGQADVDMTVSSENQSAMLHVDASADAVNVGTSTSVTDVTFQVASNDAALFPKGTTAERPAVGVAGMFRYNTTTSEYEYYNGSDWAGFGTEFTLIASETFSGDDVTTGFTLSSNQTTASCIVSINGVVQLPGTAYSVSGTTLTFTEAPATGDTIEVRELTTTTSVNGVDNGVVSIIAGANLDVTGHLIPTANETYDLGSDSFRWNDLYLSGTTIHLGTGVKIKNEAGTVTFEDGNGDPVPVDLGSSLDPDITIDGGSY